MKEPICKGGQGNDWEISEQDVERWPAVRGAKASGLAGLLLDLVLIALVGIIIAASLLWSTPGDIPAAVTPRPATGVISPLDPAVTKQEQGAAIAAEQAMREADR